MNSASTSAAIERRFYTIVRWFGLITTSIALTVAIIAAFNGLSNLLPVSSPSVHMPTTTYDDFRRMMETSRSNVTSTGTDTTLKQKEAVAAAAAAEANFEKRLKPHLDAIVTDLTSYVAKTDQAKPAAQAVGDYVRSNMQRIQRSGQDDSLAWGYVEGLEKATHELSADGDRLSKLEENDPRRVRWNNFFDWYTQQYIQQIGVELDRINAERLKAVSDAAQAPAYFYAGAVAFGVFILATLLLLLLRIELNTRPST